MADSRCDRIVYSAGRDEEESEDEARAAVVAGCTGRSGVTQVAIVKAVALELVVESG